MTEHVLKIQPKPYRDLESGVKTGEVRNCADRDFKVGDGVRLIMIDETSNPTGNEMYRQITHVQTGYGLPDDICVLSYAPIEALPVEQREPAGYVGLNALGGLRGSDGYLIMAEKPERYLDIPVYRAAPEVAAMQSTIAQQAQMIEHLRGGLTTPTNIDVANADADGYRNGFAAAIKSLPEQQHFTNWAAYTEWRAAQIEAVGDFGGEVRS